MPHLTTAPTGAGDILDRLFDAIRNHNSRGVCEILNQHPDLVNDFNKFRPETPQWLFDNKRFEYILTQDILRRDLEDENVVTGLCLQKPLHLACIIGDMETVKVLLEQKNIDLENENQSGETSFSLACRSANLHTAKLLLEKGFKLSPGMKDNANNRPLDYLVYQGISPNGPKIPQRSSLTYSTSSRGRYWLHRDSMMRNPSMNCCVLRSQKETCQCLKLS